MTDAHCAGLAPGSEETACKKDAGAGGFARVWVFSTGYLDVDKDFADSVESGTTVEDQE